MRIRSLTTLLLAFGILVGAAGAATAQSLVFAEKLFPSDGVDNDTFGNVVALQSDRLFVSRSGDDDFAENAGAIDTYRFEAGGWVEGSKIVPSLLTDVGNFGSNFVVEGDTLFGFAVTSDTSTGYASLVFRNESGDWINSQVLDASDGQAGSFFGARHARDGDTVVIGAIRHDSGGEVESGAAYVFEYDGSSWVETQRILPPNPESSGSFSNSMAIGGDTLFIGSRGPSLAGGVDAYRFDGSSWVFDQSIYPSSGAGPSSEFGTAIAYEGGDIALFGAPNADGRSGLVYVYRFDGSQWIEEGQVSPADGPRGQEFGSPLVLRGDRVLIGARSDDTRGSGAGAAYVYRLVGTELVFEQKIVPDGLQPLDAFPYGMDTDGGRTVLGSAIDDELASRAGAVYVYQPSCLEGTVNIENGAVLNSLFISGTAGGADRTVEVGDGDFVEVTVLQPPSGGNGRFVLHGNIGRPGYHSLVPFEVGVSCFPLLRPNGAAPVIVANNIGKRNLVGTSEFFGNPQEDPDPATTAVSFPPLPFGSELTFQAVIIDPSSASPKAASMTNAVMVRVE